LFKTNLSTKALLIALSFALVFTFSPVLEARDDFKAGTVDLQVVVQSHQEAADFQAELQQEMMMLQEEFEEQVADLDPDQDEEEMMMIQQQFQQQVAMIEEGADQELLNVIEPDLDEFREAEGYDLILADMAVISGAEDVTDEFLEFINGEVEEPEMELEIDDDDL